MAQSVWLRLPATLTRLAIVVVLSMPLFEAAVWFGVKVGVDPATINEPIRRELLERRKTRPLEHYLRRMHAMESPGP